MDGVFEQIIEKKQTELLSFYNCFFKDEEEEKQFLNQAYQSEENNVCKSWQMVLQIERFVTLANRIDEIYPPRDGLRVLFIRICMESMASLGGYKFKSFCEIFEGCFSIEAKECFQKGIRLVGYRDSKGLYHNYSQECSIKDLLYIIKIARDNTVHDGDFWSTQIFAMDEKDDAKWCCEVTSNDSKGLFGIISSKDNPNVFDFTTTISFGEFCHFFTLACIKYVEGCMDV